MVLAIFQTNICEAKVFLFSEVVTQIRFIENAIENKNEVTINIENDFGISCKSESHLVDYRNWVKRNEANAAKGGTTVYQAVGTAEKASINSTKSFLLKEGGAESKWFAKSLEDAHWYGSRLYPNGYNVVQGTVNSSVNIGTYWYPAVDIGSYVFPRNVLPYITPIFP